MPHRVPLLQHIISINPDTVFEFGCGQGANLHLIKQALPNTHISGADLSPVAIAIAKIIAHLKNKEINFFVASETKLENIPSHSYDVILCDSVIFYLSPEKIQDALSNLVRITKKRVVLSIWHTDLDAPIEDNHHYIYNFKKLLADITDIKEYSFLPFDDTVWNDERWIRYGKILIIEKNNS